jgi:hypothetical protein
VYLFSRYKRTYTHIPTISILDVKNPGFDLLLNRTSGRVVNTPASCKYSGGSGSNLVPVPACLMVFVVLFSPSRQMPRPLPSISSPIHYALIILPTDAMQPELLTASLNESQVNRLIRCCHVLPVEYNHWAAFKDIYQSIWSACSAHVKIRDLSSRTSVLQNLLLHKASFGSWCVQRISFPYQVQLKTNSYSCKKYMPI